jgi:hypothetical protein
MELKTENYSLSYDENSQTIVCEGVLRFIEMQDYEPIWCFLGEVIGKKPERLTLNLRGLKFLNSSGFNVLSKFVLKVRQETTIQLLIQGAKSIPWHKKSLTNLQRLMPALQIELD